MEKNKEKNLISKPPVVVVVGQVDHGKTSILDFIRKTKVAEKEIGGITQHIGAYEIEFQGKKITFIDTPGHEAFSAMRRRGIKVADIGVLVVDATEGVKPQTKEAIEVAKNTQLPFIVALNKIDRTMEVRPEEVKKELIKAGVIVESLGGKIPTIETSAKTGQGIEELLEIILLMAEIESLKTDLNEPAEGALIETLLDPQKGIMATLILEKGILKKGDIIGTPSAIGKIRRINDFQGREIEKAFPAQPIQIFGFNELPKIGESFKSFPDLETAKSQLKKEKEEEKRKVFFIEAEKKVLNILLKADVLGSLEAIEDVIKNLPQEEVILRVIERGIGDVTAKDICLAENAKAKIFAFRVKIDENAKFLSQQKKIFPKTFKVIYELIEEIRKTMEKLLEPEIKRIDLAKIKIIALFKKEKEGQIIGGRVMEGEVIKDVLAEVVRENQIIGKGKIKRLQEKKEDIVSAFKGKEIGILFVGESEIQEGDILIVYKEEIEKKVL